MKHLRIALLLAACGLSNAAMATSASYVNLGAASPTSTSGITAWQASPTLAQYCTAGSGSCAVGGGSNYGNSATFAATAGSGSVTISAFGTQSLSTTASTIQRGWLGDYGNPNGFGVTSQSPGELNGSNQPAATQATGYQHAVDSTQAYDLVALNFSSAVTLNSLSIGFGYGDTDATVLEYIGSGTPGSIVGLTLNQLLTNGWRVAYDLFNMTVGTPNAPNAPVSLVNPLVASQYWMVGAYIPSFGGNGAGDGVADVFKVNGFTTTTGLVTGQSVPEPTSIALFGIAGAALYLGRRRRTARAS